LCRGYDTYDRILLEAQQAGAAPANATSGAPPPPTTPPTTANEKKISLTNTSAGVSSLSASIAEYKKLIEEMTKISNSDEMGFKFGEVDATNSYNPALYSHRTAVETLQNIFNVAFVCYLKVMGLYTLQLLTASKESTLNANQLQSIVNLKTLSQEVVTQVRGILLGVATKIVSPDLQSYQTSLASNLNKVKSLQTQIENNISAFKT
jgi:hypothetical protein